MANYLPDDIVQHIINWKEVNDTKEHAFNLAKNQRDIEIIYNAKCKIWMALHDELKDWPNVEHNEDDDDDDDSSRTSDDVLVELNKAFVAAKEIEALRDSNKIVARAAIQSYLTAKILVA